MHVTLFVCGYFHTHSLSTGRCLWRSDWRSDLSSFSLYLSRPWCHFLVHFLSHTSISAKWDLHSVRMKQFVMLSWMGRPPLPVPHTPEWCWGLTAVWCLSCPPPPFVLCLHFPCSVYCVFFVFRCSVVWLVCPPHETRDTHSFNTPHSALSHRLRYPQHQHHHRGHRRLHPPARPHPCCYGLGLQVSVPAASLIPPLYSTVIKKGSK